MREFDKFFSDAAAFRSTASAVVQNSARGGEIIMNQGGS